VCWVALLVLLAGCGVPAPPSIPELQGRASRGVGAAAAELLELVGSKAPADIRAEAYRSLLAAGGEHAALIVKACRDRDPVRREHALALAANLKLAGAAAEALRALEDRSFPRRYVAAWALGELGDPTAVGPLVRALGQGQGETSKEAARSLVKLGKPAVPMLIEALPGLTGEGRGYALRTLGELQDLRALEALVAALADPGSRTEAAWALGKLGASAATDALLPLLDDPAWQVRLEASRSLGLLEARQAQEALAVLREQDPAPAVREWAARSLALLKGVPQTYPNARGEWVLPDELYR